MELVIEGNAFIDGEIKKCCIGIEEGKISAVKKILKGDKHHDFGEKLILPGGIDAHVHFRDPGMTHKEDFSSGTIAAAYGGITCALDMPNTKPPVTDVEKFNEKAKIAAQKTYVDFGLYVGVTQNSEINKLSKYAAAFKIYLATTTGNMLIKDYKALPGIFEEIGRINKTVSLHCEDESLIKKNLMPNSLEKYLLSRPNECEAQAMKKVIENHDEAKVHICHVSTSEGVKLLENSGVTSEVTPHHLLLNSKAEIGALGKVNPPLRKKEDQEALWNALKEGKIDIIASDHAPHTLEEKEHFADAPSGIPGVETMLPMMLSHVKHDKFQLSRLVNAISEKPSEIFKLNKGKLKPGFDGDIIVVDMRKETEIKSKNLHSKCGWTPYEEFSAVFPRFTFLRGECVIEDWELVGDSGFGKLVEQRNSK